MLLDRKYTFRIVSKKQIKAQQRRRVSSRLPPLEQSSVDTGAHESFDESVTLIEKGSDIAAHQISQYQESGVVETKENFQTIENQTSEAVLVNDQSQAPEYVDARKRSFLKLASMAGLGAVAVSMIPKKAEAYVMGASPTSSVVGVKNSSNTRVNPATEDTLLTLLAGQGVVKLTTTLAASGNVRVPASGKKIRVYSTRFSLTADMTSVSFRFTSGGTDYEKYVSPKTGGLYGSNNHPNYVEGGVDEALYCVINGTGSVQINMDYMEV